MHRTVLVTLISTLIAASAGGSESSPHFRMEAEADQTRDPGAGGTHPTVVEVDCAAGRRIGDALRKPAAELAIRVRGFCDEHVEIDRDVVTLVGSDPSVDRVRVLSIHGATDVIIENLGIGGSQSTLIGKSSDVRMIHCDPASLIKVTQGSRLAMKEIGGGSVWAELGSRISCQGCALSYVALLDGSVGSFRDSSVGATYYQFALTVDDRSSVSLVSSELVGITGILNSTMRLKETDVTGQITLDRNSHAALSGANIQGPERFDIVGFSTVWIEPGSSYRGNLSCSHAGTVSCEGASIDGFLENCPPCAP